MQALRARGLSKCMVCELTSHHVGDVKERKGDALNSVGLHRCRSCDSLGSSPRTWWTCSDTRPGRQPTSAKRCARDGHPRPGRLQTRPMLRRKQTSGQRPICWTTWACHLSQATAPPSVCQAPHPSKHACLSPCMPSLAAQSCKSSFKEERYEA